MSLPGLPVDASRDGHRVDTLLAITLVFTATLLVALVVWLLLAARHRGPVVHDRGDSRRAVLGALGLSLAVFLIVDGTLWLRSTLDMTGVFWNFAYPERHDPPPVRVQVNAHQWAWDFRYPSEACLDAGSCDDDIYATNELVIPIGRPVILELAAVDVIHSFFVPAFRVKMDAVPGRVTRLWFQAEKPGVYEAACAEHCGPNHYKMRAVVRVVSDEDYREWERSARAVAVRQAPARDEDHRWGWPW